MIRLVYTPVLLGLGIAGWRLGSDISATVAAPWSHVASAALRGFAGTLLLGALHAPYDLLVESRWVRKWLDSTYARWEDRVSDRREHVKKEKDVLARLLENAKRTRGQDAPTAAAPAREPKPQPATASESSGATSENPAVPGREDDNAGRSQAKSPHEPKKA